MKERLSHTVENTVEWYRQQLRDQHVSVATRRTYVFLVRQFLNFAEQREPGWQHSPQEKLPELLRDFLNKTSTGTVNTRRSAINHFLTTTGISHSPPPTRVLNVDELSRFLTAARQEPIIDRSIAFLLATTGIQLSAAARLTRACFEYIESTLFMVVTVSGEARRIPLNLETQYVFEELLSQLPFTPGEQSSFEYSSSIWIDRDGHSLSMRDLTCRVKSIGWTVNLFVTPIILRRTRLAQMAKSSNDAVTLAYLGMFDDIQSAQRILRKNPTRSGELSFSASSATDSRVLL